MSRTYNQMVQLVRDWSNRDEEALPDSIIQDSLRWAADKAYRTLRVPPLEQIVTYGAEALAAATSSSNNRFASVTELTIPEDLIEFIQIRGIDTEGRTTRMFNEKADVRTFNDLYSEKYSDLAFWTRQGNCILLSPGFGQSGGNYGSIGVGVEEGVELYYYRRLPAVNARYFPSAINANLELATQLPQGSTESDDVATLLWVQIVNNMTGNILLPFTYYEEFEEIAALTEDGEHRAETLVIGTETLVTVTEMDHVAAERRVQGNETPHWLRDDNERVLLMGALAEVFFYLQENDEATKYAQLFQAEIAELNDEDVRRNASGGNVQVNFNGRGMI